MWSTAREIAAGDLVIVWLTRDIIQPLLVTPGKDFNSKFGNYRHSDLVGIPYGSKVGSRRGKGFIHVLRPTPELWTMALPHRTQILYLADIAFITSYLDIKRASCVIEAGAPSDPPQRSTFISLIQISGTGSGSFSHSVARTIGASGHLWSYEFHEARASKARAEFSQHGMDDIVTLVHRNVCKDGFTVSDAADSVFLDLPAPWEAVEHAKKALRKDRTTRICCFSPCIEQVLRTVSALNDAGFIEITMYETLLRPHDVTHVPVLQHIDEISGKLKQAERKREDKRLRQISMGRPNVSNAAKRKREGDVGPHAAEGAEELAGSKRVKTDDEDNPAPDGEESQSMDFDPLCDPVGSSAKLARSPVPTAKISVSKVMSEVRGHTSYLTFASLQPFTPALASEPNERIS